MFTRRRLLMTGGAALVLLGGGFGGFVATRTIAEARAPWLRATEGYGDPRLDALAYAILAPNPHNLQPWQVRLDEQNGFTLFCDLDRVLPFTDPPNRQIVIGLGAFLELFRQAAAENGYQSEVIAFPQGEPQPVLDTRPIATVRIFKDPSIERDPLFDTVLDRRTMRVLYDDRAVAADRFTEMQTILSEDITGSCRFAGTVDQAELAWHKKLHTNAWNVELETKHTHAESLKWTRNGSDAVNANPDGISLYGPALDAMAISGMMTVDSMKTPGSAGFEGTRDFYNDLIDSAHGFGWLATAGNSRLEQLQAGAAWVRLNQQATKLGLAMHPLSQALQEFPEMAEYYATLHSHLNVAAPARVQGLFRFGYAEAPGPAPRWPLESRILEI